MKTSLLTGVRKLEIRMISQSKINFKQMITHNFPFEKAQDAFELAANYKDAVIKAMINF